MTELGKTGRARRLIVSCVAIAFLALTTMAGAIVSVIHTPAASAASPSDASTSSVAGSVSVTPDPIDFACQSMNCDMTVNVTVTARQATSVTTASVSPPAQFSITSDGCMGLNLATSEQCTINVRFVSATPGLYHGLLSVLTTQGTETVQVIATVPGTTTTPTVPRSTTSRATTTSVAVESTTIVVTSTTRMPAGSTVVTTTTPAIPTTRAYQGPTTTRPRNTTTSSRRPQPSTTSTQPLSLAAQLTKCKSTLHPADITYQTPRHMVVGTDTDIEVLVNRSDLPTPTFAFPGTAPTTLVRRQLACDIQGTLSGDGFAVAAPVTQYWSFIQGSSIDWLWEVRPLRAGRLQLFVRIQGAGNLAPGEYQEVGDWVTKPEVITVVAAKKPLPARVNNWVVDIATHPVVLLLASTGGLLGAWKWLKGRLTRTKAKKNATT